MLLESTRQVRRGNTILRLLISLKLSPIGLPNICDAAGAVTEGATVDIIYSEYIAGDGKRLNPRKKQ